MNLSEQQKQRFILNSLCFLTAFAWLTFLSKIAIPYTVPFIAGLVIAFLLKPVTLFLSKSLRIRRRGASLFVIGLFYSIVVCVIWFVVLFLSEQVRQLIVNFPERYSQDILPFFAEATEKLSDIITAFVPDAAEFIHTWFGRLSASIGEILRNISGYLVSKGTQIAAGVPLFFMTVLFTILCSVMISLDYSRVVSFLLRQLPPIWRTVFFECKEFIINTLFKMAKAYLILLSITFVELSIGLFFLGIKNPISTAAIIAFLDLLPLIGTGGVMIPWAILELIRGEVGTGIGLLALYGIIGVIRNILEPKVVSQSIGLHPLVTIISMYIGLRILGFWGLLLGPITALLLQFLNNRGRIHLYNN